MPQITSRHRFWWGLLVATVVCGLLSRLMQTGLRIVDKYLGDRSGSHLATRTPERQRDLSA